MADKEQFNQVLENLKKKNEQRVISVWLPSLNKGVDFKHLTLEQQKTLIKSSIKENLLKLDFSRNIYDNCMFRFPIYITSDRNRKIWKSMNEVCGSIKRINYPLTLSLRISNKPQFFALKRMIRE